MAMSCDESCPGSKCKYSRFTNIICQIEITSATENPSVIGTSIGTFYVLVLHKAIK